MIALGIETSCDETGISVSKDGKILSSEISSSVHLHAKYGGIVPEIASRYHIEYLMDVAEAAVRKSGVRYRDVDVIGVTYGPGLCGSLLVGISFAKALALALKKPLVGVNHIAAHLYANFIRDNAFSQPRHPFMGLVISGGHTSLYLCKSITSFKLVARTQDDAVGEAFDKVAKILGLAYPGGPIIEKMAAAYRGTDYIKFTKPNLGAGSLDFSFSGIKTAVLYYTEKNKIDEYQKKKIAYSFQKTVFDFITERAVSACKKFKVNRLVVGGGVAANKALTACLAEKCKSKNITVFIPGIKYCLDNGAMVAVFAELLYKKGKKTKMNLTAEPNLEGVLCR